MTRRIALFARPPVPGRVKSRLEPGLTAGLACELYRACLEDALGPTRDGGYYLIALTRPERRLFEGVAWGTPRVLEQTHARAKAAGRRVALLDPLEDIDTPADVVRLIGRACRPTTSAAHARRALALMGLLPPSAA